MPAETKTIKLKDPITFGTKTLAEITLRAPAFEDFMLLGEPEFYVPLADGRAGYVETNIEVVRAYIERLIDKTVDINLLQSASLTDTMALRDAVLDFFRDARRKNKPPSTPGPDALDTSASGVTSPSQASTG